MRNIATRYTIYDTWLIYPGSVAVYIKPRATNLSHWRWSSKDPDAWNTTLKTPDIKKYNTFTIVDTSRSNIFLH